MTEHDKADLDGDGEFDAIDITILEDGEPVNKNPPGKKSGCCVLLLVGGTVILSFFLLVLM
jgi:hypothetical protein